MWDLLKIVIPKVKTSWVELAYSMDYEIDAVRGFERDGRSLDERCHKLFEDWLTTGQGCTPKTWQTPLQQVKQVDELIAAVEDIKKPLSNNTYEQCITFCSQLINDCCNSVCIVFNVINVVQWNPLRLTPLRK